MSFLDVFFSSSDLLAARASNNFKRSKLYLQNILLCFFADLEVALITIWQQ